jgi:cold shock protein
MTMASHNVDPSGKPSDVAVHSHFDIEALLASMNSVVYGVIRSFDSEPGCGFITPDDGGSDIVVHRSEITGNGLPVRDGQRVSYRIGGTHARPAAETVHVL